MGKDPSLEKEYILGYLKTRYENAKNPGEKRPAYIDLNEVIDYLKLNDFSDVSKERVGKELGRLIKAGHVSSKKLQKPDNHQEVFYLSKLSDEEFKQPFDKEERSILFYLGYRHNNAKYPGEKLPAYMSIDEVVDYLKSNKFSDVSEKRVRKELDRLIKSGHLNSKKLGKGDNNQEVFYLSDSYKKEVEEENEKEGTSSDSYWTRENRMSSGGLAGLLGFVFLLASLGIVIYEGLNMTGAVVGVSAPKFLISGVFLLIGLFLLSLRQRKAKK
jgi:predicted transcriptional regulator